MANGTSSTRVERVSHLRWVPIAEMKVAPTSQREFKIAQAEEYAADFDLEGFGFPVVNFRDGRWYIVDGQHRVAALKMLGWGDQQIQCEAYEGLTEAEEAEMFLKRNKRRNVTPFDTFRVGVNAGREAEQDIDRIVRSAGCKISKDSTDGSIAAVTALHKVYAMGGPSVLARTVRIVRDSYGGHAQTFRGEVLQGVGLLCQRFNGQLDDAALIDRMTKLPNGVYGLRNRANIIKHTHGVTLPNCVAAALVEAVNAGRGGKKLPDWFKATA